MRWIGTTPNPVVFLVKFTVVLSIVLGAALALFVAGVWIGGEWLGLGFMLSPMLYGVLGPALRRRRIEHLPTARSLRR